MTGEGEEHKGIGQDLNITRYQGPWWDRTVNPGLVDRKVGIQVVDTGQTLPPSSRGQGNKSARGKPCIMLDPRDGMLLPESGMGTGSRMDSGPSIMFPPRSVRSPSTNRTTRSTNPTRSPRGRRGKEGE